MTRAQRHKEESSDYRYFPDPDLVPVVVSSEDVETQHSQMQELPAACRQRLQSTMGISAYDADVIVNQGRTFVAYFEQLVAASGNAKRAGNWIQQDVLRVLNENTISIDEFTVSAVMLGQLLKNVDAGELDTSRAKDVFQRMVDEGETPEAAMKALGIEKVDNEAIEQLCRELLAANPSIVEDVRSGKKQAIGALIGQARKKNPNANPGQVREICLCAYPWFVSVLSHVASTAKCANLWRKAAGPRTIARVR